uniref:NAD(P)H dehydrogenase subunit H n=1 Tax=Oryza meridionalis TaxID=40149 RepID=A0A0E0EN61_9ORYZ
MSFNSRTRNWKVTEGDPSFCNENYIKNSGQFRNQAKRLNTYAKKFIIGPPLIRRFNLYESLLKKKKKTGVLLNFKYSVSPIRYGDLLHIWNYTKKIFHRKEVSEDFWENVNDMSLPLTRKDLMIVNMGPQHPSMHGVLRLIVTLDGEDRNGKNRGKPNYYTILTLCNTLGLFSYYVYRSNNGMRMMHNYFRIGGVAADLPYGWIDKCLDFCDYFLRGVIEYQQLITQNPIFLERVEGVGFISGEEAVNWGLSGPMLRASGIQWDLRKVDLYESYNQFDWKVQWQKEGDSLARYLVRIGEMRESIKIIQQAVEKIPGGPYENLEVRRFKKAKNSEWNDFEYRFLGKKPSPNFELSKQELYARVEAPKGELGIYLVGDDSLFPWRWKIRPPGFINLQILPQLVKKMKLADIMTILGSIDIIMGEVDR